jgi:hypothetical protein
MTQFDGAEVERLRLETHNGDRAGKHEIERVVITWFRMYRAVRIVSGLHEQ